MKKRVLFLCTHNSARSQMAEGLLRRQAGDRFEVFSAGTEATRAHPLAIKAMNELGLDISRHRSKTIDELGSEPQAQGGEEEKLRVFRTVRDGIAGRLRLFQTIAERR